MTKESRIKAGFVLLLGAAAMLTTAGEWTAAAFIAFGLFNALFAPPGTFIVRAPVVLCILAALLGPEPVRVAVTILIWLVWPPAYAVAWSLAGDYEQLGALRPDRRETAGWQSRLTVAAMIGAVSIASIVFRLITAKGLQQTAALFIGVPAILAIVVVLFAPPRSAVGVACKAVTVGLLVSLLFLGEGILCVIMSAPLFYLVAIAIASVVSRLREPRHGSATLFSSAFLLALVPMSLEGVTELTTIARAESISVTKLVEAAPEDIERALFEPPRFDRQLPPYLRAGFPTPLSTRIERTGPSPRWVIELRGGEMRLNGMEPRTGDLVLELQESRPGRIRWRAVSDTSHMPHFLTWREVIVEWAAVDERRTAVTWTLRYDRGLDPAWYFGPWERYAVRLAAGYLIDTVATP